VIEINKIHQMDCIEGMKQLPPNYVDLTITSPPYDNLRDYKGYSFDFETTAKEIYRVTKEGGIVVWVIGDATVDGSETGTSFKQALYFKEIGFNLHDTMIYEKNVFPFPPSNRYFSMFEYMFIFSKGIPKTTNLLRVKTIWKTGKTGKKTTRQKDGSLDRMKYETGKDTRIRSNVWRYETGFRKTTNDEFAFKHPAMFPEKLAEDHILSWSKEGDIILDPLCGSGTTCKMAMKNNRNFIGIEISEEYCKIANKRLEQQTLEVKSGCDANDDGIPPNNKLLGILPNEL